MPIRDETISAVQQNADILEVVEDYLPLKKKGQNWWALSPFTEEKTPSFSVNPQKGIYKCFSTGKGGDAISFVMEMDGVSFIDAIKILAKKYSIPIEETALTEEQKEIAAGKESLYIVLNFALGHFKDLLHKHDEGKGIGLSYFKERGFANDTIEAFELGYSLNQWENLKNTAESKGYKEEILEKAGLILKNDKGKIYDRFRGRVMFPIHNVTGRVIGFGARTLKKDDKPKYLNSPESEIYQKSDILYGIFQAKKAIREKDNCFLVEGYTDVISLHQGGIANVVASSGTSLTESQIRLVSRFTKNITVLYDGDPAGIKASLRGIDLILEKGLDVKIVLFPEGEDPDSFMQKLGGEKFGKYLQEQAEDFILFKTNLGLKEAKNDPAKRAEVIRDIVASIVKIPDAIKRSVFYRECSDLLEIEEELLIDEGNKILIKEERNRKFREERKLNSVERTDGGGFMDNAITIDSRQASVATLNDPLNFQERECIRILLEYGKQETEEGGILGKYILEEIEQIAFNDEISKSIIAEYSAALNKGEILDAAYFVKHPNQEIKQLVIDMISEKNVISKNWEKHHIIVPEKDAKLHQVVYSNVLRLKYRTLKKMCLESIELLNNAKSVEEENEALQVYQTLKHQENELAKFLGIVYS
ncbi:MAG: DNA primase [Bacteroidota bacterium]